MLITAQYHTPVLVSQGTWLPRRIHSQVPVMPACFTEDAFYDCFAAFFKTALDNVVSARVKHQAQCAWRCAEK